MTYICFVPVISKEQPLSSNLGSPQLSTWLPNPFLCPSQQWPQSGPPGHHDQKAGGDGGAVPLDVTTHTIDRRANVICGLKGASSLLSLAGRACFQATRGLLCRLCPGRGMCVFIKLWGLISAQVRGAEGDRVGEDVWRRACPTSNQLARLLPGERWPVSPWSGVSSAWPTVPLWRSRRPQSGKIKAGFLLVAAYPSLLFLL